MLTLFLYEEEKNNKIRSKNTENISPGREFFNVALFMKSDSSSRKQSHQQAFTECKKPDQSLYMVIQYHMGQGHNDAACHMLYVQYICNRLLRIVHLHREKSIRISCPVSYSLFQCDKHIITK